MSKFFWLIDNGHGGIIDGKYTTCIDFDRDNPRTFHKMWVHRNALNGEDLVLFEGVYNRLVAKELVRLLELNNIEHKLVTPEEIDVPLSTRVRRANQYQGLSDKPSRFISIHANGGKGTGIETWYHWKSSKSKAMANIFQHELINGSTWKDRGIKGAYSELWKMKIHILRKTAMPAILPELGFFDNISDAKFMSSEEGVLDMAKRLYNGIVQYEAQT